MAGTKKPLKPNNTSPFQQLTLLLICMMDQLRNALNNLSATITQVMKRLIELIPKLVTHTTTMIPCSPDHHSSIPTAYMATQCKTYPTCQLLIVASILAIPSNHQCQQPHIAWCTFSKTSAVFPAISSLPNHYLHRAPCCHSTIPIATNSPPTPAFASDGNSITWSNTYLHPIPSHLAPASTWPIVICYAQV